MGRRWAVALIGVGLILGVVSAPGYAEDKAEQGPPPAERSWQVGFVPSYSSGNFGTGTTSTFFSAPISVRRYFADGDVTVLIPFVTATTDGRVTIVGGQPTRVDNSGPGSSGSGGGGTNTGSCSNSGKGNSNNCGTTTRVAGQTVTTAGLGDIIVKGRYYLVEEKDYLPLIAVTARVKIPTADASQGLGTGAWDYGAGTEVSKLWGEKWITYMDGGYNVIGDPSGLQLRNQYWYDVGAGYYFTKDFLFSVYFEIGRAHV